MVCTLLGSPEGSLPPEPGQLLVQLPRLGRLCGSFRRGPRGSALLGPLALAVKIPEPAWPPLEVVLCGGVRIELLERQLSCSVAPPAQA